MSVWRPLSPARVEQRDCRSFPTSSARSDCHGSLFPSVDSEPLGWGENKFVALWSRPADQWQGGGRSWGRARRGLRRGKEGFYVTEWKIPRRDGHMPLLFLSSYTPLHPFPSLVPCLPFLFSLLCVTFRVKWCQQMLRNKCPFNCCFVEFYTCFNNKWKALMIVNNLKFFSGLQNNHFWRSY